MDIPNEAVFKLVLKVNVMFFVFMVVINSCVSASVEAVIQCQDQSFRRVPIVWSIFTIRFWKLPMVTRHLQQVQLRFNHQLS